MTVERYSRTEMLDDLVKLTGVTKKDLDEVTKAYLAVIKEALINGKEIQLHGIGKLELIYVKGLPERENQILDPRFPDVRGTKPATEGHYRVHLKVAPGLRDKVKEATLGK